MTESKEAQLTTGVLNYFDYTLLRKILGYSTNKFDNIIVEAISKNLRTKYGIELYPEPHYTELTEEMIKNNLYNLFIEPIYEEIREIIRDLKNMCFKNNIIQQLVIIFVWQRRIK